MSYSIPGDEGAQFRYCTSIKTSGFVVLLVSRLFTRLRCNMPVIKGKSLASDFNQEIEKLGAERKGDEWEV